MFIKAKDDIGGGDNWTTGAISRANLQSYHHHQQTNIQFFTDRMPFLPPNQQCQSTEGKNITFHGLAYSKLTKLWELNETISAIRVKIYLFYRQEQTKTIRQMIDEDSC